MQFFLTAIAVLLRILINPLSNVFQKQLTQKGHHPLYVNFVTYLLLSVLVFPLAFNTNWLQYTKGFWFFAILAGIAGALGNGFLVRALQLGDLSLLGPINAYKSVVSMLLGIFLVNEVPNLWGVMGIALIIYGSYFVLETTPEKFSWKLLRRPEIQFRIYAMVFTAIEAIFIKKIILYSDVKVAFLTWCWFGAVFSFLLAIVFGVKISAETKTVSGSIALKLLWLVLCVGIMQYTTNYAFAHMPVAYALALFQLSIIVTVFFGYRFFGESNLRKKLKGSVIMVIGSALIILLK